MKTAILNKKGIALIMVLSFMALTVMSAVFLASMIQHDINIIKKLGGNEKARAMAEAGINHAIANIKDTSFASRANFSNSMDTGSYSVTYSSSGGRYLVTSVGTVGGVSETASAEIYDNTPTALNYFSGAGNDISMNALIAGATVTGDIHANHDVYLKSGPIIATMNISGNVTASNIVKEGTRYNTGSLDIWDDRVWINGFNNDSALPPNIGEYQPNITFPTFDYEEFKAAAIESGTYYSGNQTFSSVTLSPSSGIVYVDGNVVFNGTSTLNGGIIADNINIVGTLRQQKSGTRNVIIAKSGTGNVSILGQLYTEEALVYAAQDIQAIQAMAVVDVSGIMLAGRNINMWNVITIIDYTYVYTTPSGMGGPNGDDELFSLVSWNS